ncbi:MAG: hypothetical protein AAF694_14660 [Bacteroidota bacterium]
MERAVPVIRYISHEWTCKDCETSTGPGKSFEIELWVSDVTRNILQETDEVKLKMKYEFSSGSGGILIVDSGFRYDFGCGTDRVFEEPFTCKEQIWSLRLFELYLIF